MRILFVGDIVGKSGRDAVRQQLPLLRNQYQPDFIIANGENAAHGKGITPKIFHELLSYQIDAITMGNHTYAKRNVEEILDDPRLIIPLNYRLNDMGSGVRYFQVADTRIGVISLMGQVFMDRDVDDPYQSLLTVLNKDTNALYFVDFHAEATGEKATLARYFASRLIAVIGTHTHIQTADERIMNGCAFLSDAGMCGAYESILGRDPQELLQGVLTHEKTRYQVAEGPAVFMGAVITIEKNRATKIERIQIRP